MTTLVQTITKQNNQAVGDHRGQKAKLHRTDSLKFTKGTGWGNAGFEEVDFYASHADCQAQTNRVGYWTPTGSSGIENRFTVASDVSSITLTDVEPTGTDEDLWYAVKIGGLRLDPEVINKGGSATPGDPTAWVD